MTEIAKRSRTIKQDCEMKMTPVTNDSAPVTLHTDNSIMPTLTKFELKRAPAAQFSSAQSERRPSPTTENIGKSKTNAIRSITPSHPQFSAISAVTLPSPIHHMPSRRPRQRRENKYRTIRTENARLATRIGRVYLQSDAAARAQTSPDGSRERPIACRTPSPNCFDTSRNEGVMRSPACERV